LIKNIHSGKLFESKEYLLRSRSEFLC
jgi:hypothetical protein